MLTSKIVDGDVIKEIYDPLYINNSTDVIAYNALKTIEYIPTSDDIQSAVTFKSGAEVIQGSIGIQNDMMVLGDANIKGTLRVNELITNSIPGLNYEKVEDAALLVNGYDSTINVNYYKKAAMNMIDIATLEMSVTTGITRERYYNIALDVSEYMKTGAAIHTILSSPNAYYTYSITEKDITGVTTIATYINHGISKYIVGRTYTNTLITDVYDPAYEASYTGTRTITVSINGVETAEVVDTYVGGSSTGVTATIESVSQTTPSYTYVSGVLTIISVEHEAPGVSYTDGNTYVDDPTKIWLCFLNDNQTDIKINTDELTTGTNTLTLSIQSLNAICVHELVV
jgi:hypothetical protein